MFNSDPYTPNFFGELIIQNCCTVPANAFDDNIASDPLFVDPGNGDFRLQGTSPCINAGSNLLVTNAFDLDNNSRIQGGTVDIGAYEYQSPLSIISYAWLQQHGLATDGSDDFADQDGDAYDNWHEWRAGTVPTNAASVLRLLATTNSPSGAIIVRWSSVNTRTYWIERATNLGSPAAFSIIATNRNGLAGSTSYTDTTATNGGNYFYRVGVQ